MRKTGPGRYTFTRNGSRIYLEKQPDKTWTWHNGSQMYSRGHKSRVAAHAASLAWIAEEPVEDLELTSSGI